MIPVSVSGIGPRDATFVLLLSTHLPIEEATLVGIGYTFFAYWLQSLVAFPVVLCDISTYFREKGSSFWTK
jgi:hypothetical protein